MNRFTLSSSLGCLFRCVIVGRAASRRFGGEFCGIVHNGRGREHRLVHGNVLRLTDQPLNAMRLRKGMDAQSGRLRSS